MTEQCENKGSSFCADFECNECPAKSLSRKLPVIPEHASDFLQGVRKGLLARSQGKFRPLDVVVAELEIDA